MAASFIMLNGLSHYRIMALEVAHVGFIFITTSLFSLTLGILFDLIWKSTASGVATLRSSAS